MRTKPASEVLYDSDSALRLVDAAIGELGVQPHGPAPDEAGAAGGGAAPPSGDATLDRLHEVSGSLAFGYQHILEVLRTLRQGRGSLEPAALDRLPPAHARLREVTDTTETAATDLLAGIEDAIAMVNRLDALDAEGDRQACAVVRAGLRERLFDLVTHLQFQDITRQQLNQAAAVLLDTEHDLARIAAVIEPAAAPLAASRPADPNRGTWDPGATAGDAAERQALADRVVRQRGDGE